MLKLLDSYPKTAPSNYAVKEFILVVPGSEVPGYSLTEDQWDKATRQADPNYDWYAYKQAISNCLFDHPEFAHREHDEAIKHEWQDILSELEPFNPRSV